MPFAPGQSGNPGGRPKESEAYKRLARENAYRALEVMIAALDDPDVDVRLRAASCVLDRAYGRPAQSVSTEHSGAISMIDPNSEQARQMAEALIESVRQSAD